MSLVSDFEIIKDGATGDMYYRSASGLLLPVRGTPANGKAPVIASDGIPEWTDIATQSELNTAIAGIGGATTDGISPDTQPASPNAADDEFEQASGTGLDTTGGRRTGATAWAWRNQGAATFTQQDGYGILTGVGQTGSNLRIAEQVIGGASWRRRLKLRAVKVAAASNFSLAGMCVVNNTSGKVIGMYKGYNGGVAIAGDKWTNVTTYGSALFSTVNLDAAHIKHGMSDPMWMDIALSGTNLIFRYSLDGVNWTTAATEALATFISSVDRIGLIVHNDTNSNQPIGVYGWWRDV